MVESNALSGNFEEIRKRLYLSCVQFDSELKSGSMPLTAVAPIAKKLGLAGVEYREVYWRDKTKELLPVVEGLDALGLKRTFATFSTLFNRDSEARKRILEEVTDARALGASLIRVFRGEMPDDSPDDRPIWDGARAVIDRAGGLGLTVALENYARVPGNHLAEVLEALQKLDSPVLRTNIDVSNYVINGEDPVANIRELKPWIRYAHLKDVHYSGDEKVVTYLGNGELPYRDVFEALAEAGNDFPVCFEFGGEGNPEQTLRKSIEYLQQLFPA